MLFALQSGILREVTPRHIPLWLNIYIQLLRRTQPVMMRTVAVTQTLSEADQGLLREALEEAFSQFGTLDRAS